MTPGPEPDGESGDALVEVPLTDLDDGQVDAVHELLRSTFRADELVSLAGLRAGYRGEAPHPSVVVLAGGAPVAVMLAEWHVDHQVLLLAYLAVAPSMRGRGLGAHLVGDVLARWAAERDGALVLAEVDDPARWPGDAGHGDPVARLRFYGRLGARLVPLRYVQPALRASSGRVDGMLLLRLDRGTDAPGDRIAAFLEENVVACEGAAALDDPQVAGLVADARALTDGRALWPVDRWAEVRAP
ncbi:GNAT family N-acetyltransferase [Cellulomonas sp. NS3]|uniref:GNAT family N-acetyltransferase n=1 Tax=Cellulomonas sp. NS3 TaxID=2973977 RepID=UPI002163E914|nr:GNAT family N-acetyltransferase [Cellulomonas sp. NS3]